MKTARVLTANDQEQVLEIHRAHDEIMRTKIDELEFDYKRTIENNLHTNYFDQHSDRFRLYGTFERDTLLCYMAVQKVAQIAAWILNYIKIRPGVSKRFNIHKNGVYELFDHVTNTMEAQQYYKVYIVRSISRWPTQYNQNSFNGLPFRTNYIRNIEYYVPANTLPPEEFTLFRGMLGNVAWPNDVVILSMALKDELKPFPKVD